MPRDVTKILPMINTSQKRVMGVLAVLVACVCIGAWWIGERSASSVSIPEVQELSPEELERAWRQSVDALLATYDETQNAAQAKQALLQARVPAEARETHLALVLAFEALVQGASAESEARLGQAREQYEGSR